MHCPACGTENPQDAKCCLNCNAPLPGPAAPKTSEIAKASLGLGIIGFFGVGLVAGPIGIILGLFAYHRINRRPLRLRGKGLAISGIAVSILSILFYFWMWDAKNQSMQLARHAACLSQLHQLGVAITMYQNEYTQQFPPDLKTLLDAGYEYVSDNDLTCPAAPTGQGAYIYRGAGLTSDVNGRLVIIYEPATPPNGQRNVLFALGNVKRVTEDKFSVLMQQDLQLRREQGLPELPFE